MALKKFRRQVYIPSLYDNTIVEPADIAALAVTTAKLAADAVTAAKLADDAVVNANLSADLVKTLCFQYDFADLTGAQGALTLTDRSDAAQTIPDNANILTAYVEAITTTTSEGSATIMLGITNDTNAFVAATAMDNALYAAGALTELTAAIPQKTAAAESVLATVATADLTAGKFNVWVTYTEGD